MMYIGIVDYGTKKFLVDGKLRKCVLLKVVGSHRSVLNAINLVEAYVEENNIEIPNVICKPLLSYELQKIKGFFLEKFWSLFMQPQTPEEDYRSGRHKQARTAPDKHFCEKWDNDTPVINVSLNKLRSE